MTLRTLVTFLNRNIISRLLAFGVVLIVLLSGCSEIQRPKVEPFYAVTVPPRKQELRWSNGKSPKSLDPARAAAAPETDLIRAMYDGLTDLDSKSLRESPGVAERWESSDGGRVWTFYLRKNARWTNGERVSAQDFVRSWKRLKSLKSKAANNHLFQNIVGLKTADTAGLSPSEEQSGFLLQPQSEIFPAASGTNSSTPQPPKISTAAPSESDTPSERNIDNGPSKKQKSDDAKFGVAAIDDATLRVTLDLPDDDFPKLVSHPIFRPVYGDGSHFDLAPLDPDTVTNGAFRITEIDGDGISLDRSETFWNRESVALERVKFVNAASAEAALDAYKNGDVDVITNSAFEPLALKLLKPYEDFRHTPHYALNFYEFNTAKSPFIDRRIREALALSIDREKLSQTDLEGTTQPAYTFFPHSGERDDVLSFNVEAAKQLMTRAGYPGGTGFPPINLVINRNDTQQRVARSVARMWRQHLNLETVVTVKEASVLAEARRTGDFDIIRQGVVFSTNDDLVNLAYVLGGHIKSVTDSAAEKRANSEQTNSIKGPSGTERAADDDSSLMEEENEQAKNAESEESMITEADAMYELRSMPLYFPISYSLIKPYVLGFEMNGLDAPSLKEMSIDHDWQPKPN